jgi:hypothetical protein
MEKSATVTDRRYILQGLDDSGGVATRGIEPRMVISGFPVGLVSALFWQDVLRN